MYKLLLNKNKFIISILLIISIMFTACDKTQKAESDSSGAAKSSISKSKSTTTTSQNTTTTAVTPKVSTGAASSTTKSSSKSTTKSTTKNTTISSVTTKTSTASLEKSESTDVPPPSSQYSAYNLCNSSQEVVYMILNKIYNNYVGFTISVTNQSYILSSQDYINMMPGLKTISVSLVGDYPEYGITYYYVELDVYDYVPYAYAVKTGDYSFLNSSQTAVLNKAKQIAANYSSLGSDYEKELAVHNYLEDHITYTSGSGNVYNEYGALIDGKCVCDGYAKAFDLIMLLLGIDCYRVTGTADGGNHAWNKVKISGQWYNVDSTWDDSSSSYNYFNLTDDMLNDDHAWTTSDWPSASNTTKNYYYLNAEAAINQTEFDNILTAALNANKTTILVAAGGMDSVDYATAYNNYKASHPNSSVSLSYENGDGYFNRYIYTVTY